MNIFNLVKLRVFVTWWQKLFLPLRHQDTKDSQSL